MKIVSLFAGCGGLDLGLHKAGHKIVHASDFDKDSVDTYNGYFKNKAKLIDVHHLKGKELPDYDLLAGGFPCQGFSVANIYRSKDDSRNQLYTQIVRLLKESKPKFFLLENVAGILSLEKGQVVEQIVKDLTNVNKSAFGGYEVRYKKLNAADYGVPQNRIRVIFLGISKSFDQNTRETMFKYFPPTPTHISKGDMINTKFLTLRDVISDLGDPDKNYPIPNHVCNKHEVKINGYIGNRKLDWDKPSPTIVGRGGGTGGPVIAVHPNLKRRFSVRETARIQTFPDDFIFKGPISSQFRQIGNAVAVRFAEHLGHMLKKIEKQI
ncbi:DNA cytosine methyltransferase [Candidatus Methylopumilus universalis]|uniref:DNA cytosine methyltransferase n=1 Tax=Candidatus Methylopumilus universalis TaxID=2588536 RepID=UPI00111D7A43|nr:DNA cytosine methyltransferase [Candidatus Methylopumilus universalis]QDC97169.1 DNA cytosine methyltransferase [Candidatus Methylopumilus universalis]